MNKTLLIAFIATIAFALSACGSTDVPSIPTESGAGTAYFSVTDAAADMGAVESVVITFDELSVQSAGEAWTTIELEEQTFDLLELEAENALALLAQAELEEGTYNQLRLDVSSVVVTDDEGEHEVFLPSGELRLTGQLNIVENETSSATFDFLVNESLHVTGSGQYIMTPVIQLETREGAQVSVEANNRVRVDGGQVSANARHGMDVDGEMRQGRPVDVGANVSIVDGKVQVRTPQGVRVGVDIEAGVGAVVEGSQRDAPTGSAYVAVTDAPPEMAEISSVVIVFSEVSVQSPQTGWMSLELEEQTFDLLELEAEDALALLGQDELPVGSYNQIRVNVTSVTVTDTNGSHEAFLPSGVLRVVGRLNIVENESSTATLDFLVNESLHVTGEGQYIMMPVIQLEAREGAQVSVEANNRVRIDGGQVSANARQGMDIDGEMREGRPVKAGANVSIVDGKVQVRTPQGMRVGADIGVGVGADVGGSMDDADDLMN